MRSRRKRDYITYQGNFIKKRENLKNVPYSLDQPKKNVRFNTPFQTIVILIR